MEFLFSNFPPIRTANKTFADAFYGLIPQTSKLDIAVGYVSSDSLMELKRVVELNNNIHELNLIVGIGLQSSQWTRKEEDYITSYHSTQEEAVDAIKAEAEKHAPTEQTLLYMGTTAIRLIVTEAKVVRSKKG